MTSDLNRTREAVLREVNRLSLEQMRSPATRRFYDARELITLVHHRLTEADRTFLAKASRLSKASIEASVDKLVNERRKIGIRGTR